MPITINTSIENETDLPDSTVDALAFVAHVKGIIEICNRMGKAVDEAAESSANAIRVGWES